MELFEHINSDIKAAMKAKDKEKLEALRAVKSELLLLKTASGSGEEIPEDAGIKLLQKMVKQRKESAKIYKEQNRKELYEKEMQQVSYIQPYLPKQMSEEELRDALKKIIAETGASSMKDMGKVMGKASKAFAGKAEGKKIADTVKSLLS